MKIKQEKVSSNIFFKLFYVVLIQTLQKAIFSYINNKNLMKHLMQDEFRQTTAGNGNLILIVEMIEFSYLLFIKHFKYFCIRSISLNSNNDCSSNWC